MTHTGLFRKMDDDIGAEIIKAAVQRFEILQQGLSRRKTH